MSAKHDIKTKQLLKKWQKDIHEANAQVKEFAKKRQFSEAQKQQSKAVWIEACLLELEELYDD